MEWYLARVRRITASKCEEILNQKQWTPAPLKNILYSKPMIHLPQSIQWGIANEDNVRHAYITHMQAEGHTNLQVEPCGFVSHPTMGWLGASPDGVVNDTSNNPSLGIVEFKCLFTQRDNIPQEACTDPTFYCLLNNEGKMVLNRNHLYYHQVQLQLYVSAAHWCDFCIFTKKGVMVERILLDKAWINFRIPQLETYFDKEILPEIVWPHYKPSYVL